MFLIATARNPRYVSAKRCLFNTVMNGVNAVVAVITNVDALAGRIWPQVASVLGGGNSRQSVNTVSRVANEVSQQLAIPNIGAVSIAVNRTAQIQRGNIHHAFDQDFSQAFVDWSTSNARINETAANYWAIIAQQLEGQGNFGATQIAWAQFDQARRNVNMYLGKLQSPIYVPPVDATIAPDKPFLTAVNTSAVQEVLDSGDYYVTHAVAQLNRDSQLTTV